MAKVSLSFIIGLSLLATASAVGDGSPLCFVSNAGSGRYLFEYNETFIAGGVTLPPPGFFNVTCLFNGLPESGITYSYAGGDDGGIFMIDNTTGNLSLAEGTVLDYEDESAAQFTFSVACTLSNTDVPITRIAQVDFIVLPVNEFQPILSSASLSPLVFVDESTAIGTVIASPILGIGSITYTVTDEDRGKDGDITYTLTRNVTSFDVNSDSGIITLTQSLDTDQIAGGAELIPIKLTACDIDPPLDTCPNIIIRIVVVGDNDNNPVFTQELYEVTVSESVPVGTLIGRVSCTDADSGPGSFKNVTSSSTLFNVTSTPMQQDIYLGGQLDYETTRLYNITLTCYDTEEVKATAKFTVTVDAVNDNPPRFSTNEYFFTMNRIITTGNEVGRVEARDDDQGVGDQLTYNLTGNTNFQIQGAGSIILSDFVYVVEGDVIALQVTVSDGEMTDTATIQIRVNGILSIPEIILVCMGGVIFIALVLFIVVLSCYCCVCCTRLIPKQRHVDVPVDVIMSPTAMMNPMSIPLDMMQGGEIYRQTKNPYMIGQVPEGNWESHSGESEEDPDLGSFVTASTSVYTPSPYLKEMIDKFEEGEEIIRGKKPKRK